MQDESIFTKIINGDLPSHKIYEDEKSFAFLDIRPLADGHTLVVPRLQVDHLWDLPDEDYQALWSTARKIAQHLKSQLNCKRVGVLVEGFLVPHAHIHLVPISVDTDLKNPQPNPNVDHEQLAALAAKLRF